jgi:endonuclease VIII
MAEGDSIHRIAGRLRAGLAGAPLSVEAPSPRGRAGGVEQLDGRTLDEVEAVGKHLLLRFGDRLLHSHLGMVGSWRLHRPGSAWRRPRREAWAVLRSESCEAVEFGGPTLRVLSAQTARRDPLLARLGPDVLAADFDPAASIRLLRAAPDLALGEALLDQTRVSGIGNIFKSEACFAARLDPRRAVGGLSDAELRGALLAARALMGESLADGRPRRAVYRRAGLPCPACGTAIASRGQGDSNRTTYWCPRCQAAAGEQA